LNQPRRKFEAYFSVKSFILIIIGFLLVRLLVIYYWKIIEWKKLALKELNEYALNKCTFIFAQILKIQIRSNKLFPLYSYEQSRMWTAFSARLKTHTRTHTHALYNLFLSRTHTYHILQSVSRIWAICWWWFDFRLEPIITIVLASSKKMTLDLKAVKMDSKIINSLL